MDQRPSILYIFTDQQYAGAMSCTGNSDLKTPAMDRIAASGVRFEKAYCTYPLCTPSRASMFVGRMPHEVGITHNGQHIDEAFRQQELGCLLSNAGYECVYDGKWHVPEISIPEGHGFRSICRFDDVGLPVRCRSTMPFRRLSRRRSGSLPVAIPESTLGRAIRTSSGAVTAWPTIGWWKRSTPSIPYMVPGDEYPQSVG